MKYCVHCGAQIDEKAVLCVHCGMQVPVREPAASSGGVSDKAYTVLGLFVPMAGLILYLLWKDEYPSRAQSAIKGAIAGFIVGAVFTVVFLAIYFGIVMSMVM